MHHRCGTTCCLLLLFWKVQESCQIHLLPQNESSKKKKGSERTHHSRASRRADKERSESFLLGSCNRLFKRLRDNASCQHMREKVCIVEGPRADRGCRILRLESDSCPYPRSKREMAISARLRVIDEPCAHHGGTANGIVSLSTRESDGLVSLLTAPLERSNGMTASFILLSILQCGHVGSDDGGQQSSRPCLRMSHLGQGCLQNETGVKFREA